MPIAAPQNVEWFRTEDANWWIDLDEGVDPTDWDPVFTIADGRDDDSVTQRVRLRDQTPELGLGTITKVQVTPTRWRLAVFVPRLMNQQLGPGTFAWQCFRENFGEAAMIAWGDVTLNHTA